MPLIKKHSGFAMVEVMVTVTIITIGVSGMGMLLMRAIQGTQDSAQQSQAMWIVQDYVGRMRANPEGARGRFYNLDPAEIDCFNPPANICADTFQGGAEISAENCAINPNEPGVNKMAEYDNWISTCGNSSTVYDSASDFIVNPELSSACTQFSNRVSSNSGLQDCVQYLVTLKWQTKIAKGSNDAAERINENEYSMVVEFN